ncbi:MAG: GntR family transcriptional regulator [Candidatus Choladocola sp.]|nr:GntR family transcriptional regulator [Candidatus Choladocola sp.]
MEQFQANMTGEIYQYLLDMILSLEIKPGDHIPEAQIAQKFGVSRTPVREALRDLAQNGIINIYPRRYAEVAVFDQQRVRELGIAKISMDRLAINLAVYYGSKVEYENLRKYAEQCYEAAKGNDTLNRVKADMDYHYELCKTGKNRTLMDMQHTLLLQLSYLQAARCLNAEDPKEQYNTHLQIIDALYRGDAAAGRALITAPSVRFYDLTDLPRSLYEN